MTGREVQAYAAATAVGSPSDSVKSYFGMRKISTGIDHKTGKMALLLNNKPLFQTGTLDQCWWLESLLTPPYAVAARSDHLFLTKAGLNLLSKHLKVEPAQDYQDDTRTWTRVG